MTFKTCKMYRKPRVIYSEADLLNLGERTRRHYIDQMRLWLHAHNVKVLNVAGNRESVCEGIGLLVEEFLVAVLMPAAQEQP